MTQPTPRAVSRVALMTSGGDSPGMNAALRASVVLLKRMGVETEGIMYGYKGLLERRFKPLGPDRVARILRDGGTILGSARCPEFHERAARDRARAILAERGVDGLIVIGGNGSLTGANLLAHPDELGDQKLTAVGIPASIDNDIGMTGQAIGVDTAMNTIVDACDKIADTASAFDRTFVIEVMGRDCGYLAMTAGVASGADNVLFPEAMASDEALVESVVRTVDRASRRSDRSRHTLIIKAEGTGMSTDELKRRVDGALLEHFGAEGPVVETRVTVLGHVVRGGRPSAFDRLLASRFAHAAVDALTRGVSRHMTAWMLPWDPEHPIQPDRSPVDPYIWLVPFDDVITETARLKDGTSALTAWRKRVFSDIEDVLVL